MYRSLGQFGLWILIRIKANIYIPIPNTSRVKIVNIFDIGNTIVGTFKVYVGI